MNDTATTTALTADHIRDMVRSDHVSASNQQSWIWRSLLYCFREMQRDIGQYRKDMGRVENRNSPAYWIDWMSDGGLHKNSSASDVHTVILTDTKNPPRDLSGSHMDKAVQFLTTEGVAEAVLRFVQRPL